MIAWIRGMKGTSHGGSGVPSPVSSSRLTSWFTIVLWIDSSRASISDSSLNILSSVILLAYPLTSGSLPLGMVKTKKEDLDKELTEKKEILELRVESIEKQEESIKEKFKTLQEEVMNEMKNG